MTDTTPEDQIDIGLTTHGLIELRPKAGARTLYLTATMARWLSQELLMNAAQLEREAAAGFKVVKVSS